MMLEAAETLEPVDVAAARDVMLEALHMSLMTDPLGGSVTARRPGPRDPERSPT